MENRKRGAQSNRHKYSPQRNTPNYRHQSRPQSRHHKKPHSPSIFSSSSTIHKQRSAQKRRHPLSPKAQSTMGEAYVIDTSVLASKKLSTLVTKKGLRGRIIIPDASIAELENQANQGKEFGFDGLDELAKLHELKHKHGVRVEFAPPRPSAHQIRFAKSGEIDALIRGIAYEKKATLVTSDFVQAKSAAAYGIKVWFIKSESKPKKKNFFPFFKK